MNIKMNIQEFVAANKRGYFRERERGTETIAEYQVNMTFGAVIFAHSAGLIDFEEREKLLDEILNWSVEYETRKND